MLMSGREKEEVVPENDFGTPEARRNAFHVVVEQPDPQDRKTRRIRLDNDMIRWYERRNHVSTIQADALRRWQADAYNAGIMPSCIGGYAQAIMGGSPDISDIRLAAQGRRNNAIRFLANLPMIGKFAALMIDTLAVNDKFIGKWFLDNGYGTPHEALVHLDKITTALAKHYGLTK